MKKHLLKKNEEHKLSEENDSKVNGGLENPFDITGDTEKTKIPGHNEDVWHANTDPNSYVKRPQNE